MLKAYSHQNGTLSSVAIGPDQALPADAIWIDALDPTAEDEKKIEDMLGLDVPNREEMREIEISSRLYQESGALIMTATLIVGSETPNPASDPVTFVLAGHRLVTLRYADTLPFHAYAGKVQREGVACSTGEAVLTDLLDAIVDRLADILERVQQEMDQLSREVFSAGNGVPDVNFRAVLRKIGHAQGLISRARESLVGIGRVITFLSRPDEGTVDESSGRSLETLSKDVVSLSDHTSYLASSINFQLDATLGLINIEQNAIIKIVSVAAVVFLPPTLIASIYGMNFDFMPELDWPVGYPFAVLLMVLSAILPYWYFKRRGWL
jgi:magnesium transporter